MKLAKWTNPRNNEVRIYINDCAFTNGNKAFICNTDGRWDVKCFGLFSSQLDTLMDAVESHLEELNGGERFCDFATALQLVK